MYPLRNDGGSGFTTLFAIFILLFIIRCMSIAVTLRSTLQNEKMSDVQGKIAEINGKYKGLTDTVNRQKKQQETMEIYKKNNFKPFAAVEQIMITLPIFMVVYRVVTIVRPIKATDLFGIWNFASTPMSEITGNFVGMPHDINNGGG
jgi:YidC/Oxa1 family membrane protein insertase